MLRRFVWRIMLVAGVVASFAVVGCSDDDDPASTGSAATGGQTTTAASSTTTANAEATTAATSSGSTAGSTGAEGEAIEVSLEEGDLGSYLVGPDGRTLYVFLRDAPDQSNCTGNCLQIWPPLLLEDGQEVEAGDGIDGTFDSIDTPSGTQVTYNQTPLYYYASDTGAGQTNGHLVGNVWFVVRPDTASTAAVVAQEDADEPFLVGPTGMTLYTFDRDTEGVSNCSGQCLANWPALTLPEGVEPKGDGADGELATITRDDGALQVTYNGMPLYYYVGDKVPGDTTGDGVNDVWHTALP